MPVRSSASEPDQSQLFDAAAGQMPKPAAAASVPTRAQLIQAGKVWSIYRRDDPETTVAERSSEKACIDYLKEKGEFKAWKRGKSTLTFGRVLAEW